MDDNDRRSDKLHEINRRRVNYDKYIGMNVNRHNGMRICDMHLVSV